VALLTAHMMMSIYDIQSKLITFFDATIWLILNRPDNEHE
jgi:hypothetical protein